MRVHKARGAATDVDRERQWNWWRAPKKRGGVHQLTRQELEQFAQENGLVVSDNATFAVERHS